MLIILTSEPAFRIVRNRKASQNASINQNIHCRADEYRPLNLFRRETDIASP